MNYFFHSWSLRRLSKKRVYLPYKHSASRCPGSYRRHQNRHHFRGVFVELIKKIADFSNEFKKKGVLLSIRSEVRILSRSPFQTHSFRNKFKELKPQNNRISSSTKVVIFCVFLPVFGGEFVEYS